MIAIYLLTVLAGVAAVFFCFASFKTVSVGSKTSSARLFKEATWKEDFKSHRLYGKLLLLSLALLVVVIVPIEMMARAQRTELNVGVLIFHLICIALLLGDLLLLHIRTGFKDPSGHGVFGAFYVALCFFVVLSGGVLYGSFISEVLARS